MKPELKFKRVLKSEIGFTFIKIVCLIALVFFSSDALIYSQSISVGNNNGGSTNRLYLAGSDLSHYIYSTGSSGNNMYFGGWDGNFRFINTNSSSEVFTINGSNVGVGVTVPSTTLDINGTLRIRGGSPGDGKVLTSSGDGTASWVTPISYWSVVGNNIGRPGQNAIATLSHVWVGGPSDGQSANLQVYGTATANSFRLPTTVPVNTQYIIKASDDGTFTWVPFRDIYNTYSNTWGSNTNTAGYKLVGTSTGTKGLTVSDTGMITVHALQMEYATGIPDYVFEKNYDLEPLSKVESYIQEYKHLPGVPSEAEFKKRGYIDVYEMNMILLKKVEELTLHIIQQDKELKNINNKLYRKQLDFENH